MEPLKIKLKGDEFLVDFNKGQLIDASNPSNKIHFNNIENNLTHLLVLYDAKTKNLATGDLKNLSDSDHLALIRLPSFAELYAAQRGTKILPAVREVPKINLKNDSFFVDIINQEFRQVNNPGNRILFRDVKDNHNHIQVVYNSNTKTAFKGDKSQFLNDPNVHVLQLPSIFAIDPHLLLDVMKRPAFTAHLEHLNKLSLPLSDSDPAKKRKGIRP